MTLKFKGKTKDIYQEDNGDITLKFKDDVTGSDGKFDPGANQVGLSIEGMGSLNLQVTSLFFQNLKGIPSHFVSSNLQENTMTVKACQVFGNGLEVICRPLAGGSFLRRYGAYVKENQALNNLVEFTLKDDLRNDPLINEEALTTLNILTQEEYDTLSKYTKEITNQVIQTLKDKDLVLHDIKYEFGKHDGKILLIDEISAGSMRASHNGTVLNPIELSHRLLEK